ncbi:hypothetical protein [Chitinophaga sp. MM2321]|uniref:hypothetical protein n=1 Tax=Chitinophaga sp. MM2321 TaxID=3137178 RepID=UPI0032D5AB72
MQTILMLTSMRVQWYANIAIVLGLLLYLVLRITMLNRIIKGCKPRSALWLLWLGLLEWLATWLYRLLIILGLIFRLLVWYTSH